jgi:hypothetical protein
MPTILEELENLAKKKRKARVQLGHFVKGWSVSRGFINTELIEALPSEKRLFGDVDGTILGDVDENILGGMT